MSEPLFKLSGGPRDENYREVGCAIATDAEPAKN